MDLRTTPHRPSARRRMLADLAVVALLGVAALLLAPLALGLDHAVVRGDAMGGGTWRGALTLDDTVPGSRVEAGDVLTFVPPAPYDAQGPVTRRVVAVADAVATTRGDAAATPDPWRLDLDAGSWARVEAHVPFVGAVIDDARASWLAAAAVAVLAALFLLRSGPPAAPDPRPTWTPRTRPERRGPAVAAGAEAVRTGPVGPTGHRQVVRNRP